MPTENRSSNTELSKIVTEALADMVSGVTGMRPPADEPLPDFTQSPIDRAVERIAALVAQPAAKHQSEPFFYALCGPDRKPHYDELCVSDDPSHLECDEVGVTVIPLYAHADTGEIERLRKELLLAETQAAYHRAERDSQNTKLNGVRAQLAEREELLREGLEWQRKYAICMYWQKKVHEALSTNAEPAPTSDGFSAEQMTTQGADGYRNGIKAAAELAADYPELAQAIRALPLPQ